MTKSDSKRESMFTVSPGSFMSTVDMSDEPLPAKIHVGYSTTYLGYAIDIGKTPKAFKWLPMFDSLTPVGGHFSDACREWEIAYKTTGWSGVDYARLREQSKNNRVWFELYAPNLDHGFYIRSGGVEVMDGSIRCTDVDFVGLMPAIEPTRL